MAGALMKAARVATLVLALADLGGSEAASAPEPVRGAAPAITATELADSVMARWPDPSKISDKGWEYNTGIVLRGLAAVYRKTGDRRYLDYVRRWVDPHLSADGSIDFGEDAGGHNLDRIQPGVLVLLLHQETKDPRYERAARWLRARFDSFPRNREGGFWHKQKYPDEMWLDGIYMGQPFLVEYGRRFGDADFCYRTAVEQATLVAARTRVGDTGLFRHAWDADGNAAWADPVTGTSPEVWGRAMGWFLMALVDVLEHLPSDHPGYGRLRALLAESARGVRDTQDGATGLWHQVLDKGGRTDNWLETSASGMFVYALNRGVARGLLDPSFAQVARKGWTGVQSRIRADEAGRPTVEGAVEGMSVQRDFEGYVSRRRLTNSTHGLCSALLAASEMAPTAAKDDRLK